MRAIVHACTVGDECLIGMGAVILDGAELGAQCLVGARALVTQQTKIPEGSLVLGAPAKVARALTPEERASLKRLGGKIRRQRRLLPGAQDQCRRAAVSRTWRAGFRRAVTAFQSDFDVGLGGGMLAPDVPGPTQ